MSSRALRLRQAEKTRTSPWTVGLAVVAGATTVAVIAVEVARVWKKGSAPLPAETDDIVSAAEEAARETFEVATVGYQQVSNRENALFNLLVSFGVTFGVVRLATHSIRKRGRFGPIRNLEFGRHHIHHFVPGIALAFVSGAVSLVSRDEELDKWLAIPFGVGAGLTLDESALLLELEDVYWTERGVVSVQMSLGVISLLGALILAARLLRRGEEEVLADRRLEVVPLPDDDELSLGSYA